MTRQISYVFEYGKTIHQGDFYEVEPKLYPFPSLDT